MSASAVLVIDDEPDIRGLLQEILEDEGYAVSTSATATAARAMVEEFTPDLVLLDIWMPDMDGISLLKIWESTGLLNFPVIMISGHGTVETAVEATRHGAVDFIEKPVSLAKLLLTVEKALSEHARAQSGHLSIDGYTPRRLPLLFGASDYVKFLREQLAIQSMRSESLLLIGEAGSGRVLFAQYAHDQNPQLTGRFVQLRCDTLSTVNAHRELYGEEDGDVVSTGYLDSAAGGTLFLTDVDLLPKSAQQCLRQAIEQQGFTRVGGEGRVPFRCRLIASSRSDIAIAIQQDILDASLARLLSRETLAMQPLREHPEDIPALLEALVDWHVEEEGLSYRHFSVAAQNRLRSLDWPGNLLEVKNLVQRILLLGGPPEIEMPEINRLLGSTAQSDTNLPLRHDLPLREARADFERQYLLRCLVESQGNIGDLAKHVGMERTHLYRKLRSLGIDLDKARE